ncbi:MAG: PAS domain-containing protein [Deltaproteobacteria bacterium]|nr:PAS domain-containing protein [Deltaproteobacteria bacterium]
MESLIDDGTDALDAIPAADLRLLVEHTPAAVAVLDDELRYLVVSRRWLEDYRVSADELRGRRHWDVFPDLLERWRDVHRRALRGEPSCGDEEPYVRADGRTDWVRWACRPWHRRDGSIGGIVLLTEVVTERRLARVAADASLARLERLLETTQDAVLFVDRDGFVSRMNAAARELFGERIAAPMTELLPQWHSDISVGRDRRPLTRATMARGATGKPFAAEVTWTTLDDGDDVRAIAFVRDATERERRHQSAVTSERLATLGRAAAMFAHEVANPLTGMSLQLQVLGETIAGQSTEIDAALDALRSGVGDLTTLLKEFRELSRPATTPHDRVAVDHVVDRVLQAQALPLQRANVDVARTLTPAWVIGDASKLAQVVLNLCRNAAEAMHSGGNLVLETRTDERRAYLVVRDDGCGIPPGFDPFALFATTKAKGTGLGLPIVAQIVAAHGGTIEHAPAEGGGTVFTVSLPAAI